ncbi:MAG TPA: fumarylacetoacetate hydrolase family protein [Cellulomonas sp.]|uniref:fumarylacetoacetate hydrolase family protein n=1 Tax=Cellulomonas sp. TaxID=40001 RepID=UPI002E30E3E9|nr:fumarylacetoacetate hydrolase family protein [Cellulomonas sp.]HEX5332216.1 fumarylacetoacetate hydrolase family protein [Cellulomonas sp.]
MKIATTTDGRLLVATDGTLAADVTAALGLTGPDPFALLLARGQGIAPIADLDLPSLPQVALGDVTLGAPVRPRTVIGAPVNYRDHQVEMHEQLTVAELGVFLKASSSVIGPGGIVELPYTDVRTDHEGELTVVLGRHARNLSPAQAMDAVLGYTCGLDITVRSTEDRSTRKSFRTFTPLGPWVVSADEVPDPGALDLRCWVGDELRQHASTADLILGVAELVAYASHVMTLEPGDVILTGTPAGVGPILPGDRVAVEISQLGRLEVTVSDAGAIAYADRPGVAHRGPSGNGTDHTLGRTA